MSEKMILDATIFWVIAALSVFGALGVVLHRSIIYSALFLIVVFMSIAGIFVLNNADFLAIAQTIIYGVGLTIILIFGVMFTGDHPFKDDKVSKSRYWANVVIAVLTYGVLLKGIESLFTTTQGQVPSTWLATPSDQVVGTFQTEGSTKMLGQLLFRDYVLPFEMASILLLVAMIGAIVIAKRRFTDTETIGETTFIINTSSEIPPDTEEVFEETFKKPAEQSVQLPAEEGESESTELAGVK